MLDSVDNQTIGFIRQTFLGKYKEKAKRTSQKRDFDDFLLIIYKGMDQVLQNLDIFYVCITSSVYIT